jgi:prephenate dehydrogenase
MAEQTGKFNDFEKYLQGLEFPADRRTVIETLRKNHAPEDFIRAAESMQSGKFSSFNNVREHLEAGTHPMAGPAGGTEGREG